MKNKLAQLALTTAFAGSAVFTALKVAPYNEANKAANDQDAKMEVMWNDMTSNADFVAKQEAGKDLRLMYDNDDQMQLYKMGEKYYEEVKKEDTKEYVGQVRAAQKFVEAKNEIKEKMAPEMQELKELENESRGAGIALAGGALVTAGLFAANAAMIFGVRRRKTAPAQNNVLSM